MSWLAASNVCPGLFYGTPAQDGFLIRIRIPGGSVNRQQGEAIANIVEQWGIEMIQVTNRANLQIRSVQTAPTPEVFQALQKLGLAARDKSVDRLRNLMASPTAGIDPQESIDTRPLVQALDAYIQTHPAIGGLPAKFSIGIDGGGLVGIGTRSAISWEHRYNEIQLSAVEIDGGIYFHLALGIDKQLCDTQVLIEPDDCVSVVAALTTVYLDYVDRSQTAKKPRMKHLLQDWGVKTYIDRVNHQLSRPLRQVATCPKLPPTQRYGHLGVHPQRQVGLSYVGVSLPLGQLTADRWRELVRSSETFGSGHLHLTPWQSVLLPDILNEQVSDLLQHLASLGFSASATGRDAPAIVACAGKPGCAAAATQTQPHALALGNYLNQRLTLDCPVNIHLTGCAKSCAQPSPAEIMLLGTEIEQNGETVEGYGVYIGDDKQLLKYPICDVAFADIPSFIEQLLRFYHHHHLPNESFEEFTRRLGSGELGVGSGLPIN